MIINLLQADCRHISLRQMIKKYFSILLMLMMVVTPVSAAFNHCSSMVMMGDLPEEKSLIDAHHDDGGTLNHQMMAQKGQTDMASHISDSCSGHSCVCGILSPAPDSYLSIPSAFLDFKPSLPFSAVISPKIKPPSQIA